MSNRVAVLCDTQNLGYDQRNPALFAFADFFHVHHYPNITGVPDSSVAGMEGDPVFVKIPFRVEGAQINGIKPVLNKITVSILAIKGGSNDFTIDSKTWNCSSVCTSGGIQSLNFSANKGYISYSNDPFNTATLVNNKKYNDGTMWGAEVQLPFVLRYDYWNNILPTVPGGTPCNSDINNDIPNVNNSWSGLAQNGWSLVLRCYSEVIGYDGFITSWQGDIPITVQPLQTVNRGLAYVARTVMYDDSVVKGTVIPQIKKSGITRIRTYWTPNGFKTPGNYFASIFIDMPNRGGVFTRRFASTDLPSESGSPFSDPGKMYYSGTAVVPNQYCLGNMRIGWYIGGRSAGLVITETNYNDAAINWGKTQAPNPVVRLGFKAAPIVIGDETGKPIGDENGNYIGQDD